MDITPSSLAHLGSLAAGWPASPTAAGDDEAALDPASWFHADADAMRIALPTGAPEAPDVASLAQRVLAHLSA